MKARNEIKGKHLSTDNRIIILEGIIKDLTLNEIAKSIKKDPTTVSKEVKLHRYLKKRFNSSYTTPGYNCKHYETCAIKYLCGFKSCNQLCKTCKQYNCNKHCSKFEPYTCKRLKRFPYVCNGCSKISGCKRDKYYYNPKLAHEEYIELLKSSREGINLEKQQFELIDNIISDGVLNGKSIHSIVTNHPELNISERTIYRYVENKYLKIKAIDLRNKVKLKPRNSYEYNKTKEIKAIREGRTYQDYLIYLSEHPNVMSFQLDLVEGKKEDHQLLMTLLSPISNFMLGFIIPSKHSNNVVNVFNEIQSKLGLELFKKIFPVILTDRGREFIDVNHIEFDSNNILRTKIFFCDAYNATQKSQLERNHQFIRYYYPKGESLNDLTNEILTLMLSHINSYPRESKNDNSPYKVASVIYGHDFIDAFNIKEIPFDNINLTKSLFRKIKTK